MTSHGTFVWYELMTPDIQAAETFYRNVVGWGAKDAGVPGMTYMLLTVGETPVAGMMTMPEQARPGWTGYIAVDDVDACAAEVEKAGGRIHRAPADIPDVGRFAVAADPQGAIFSLFKPLPLGREPLEPGTPGRTGWHELHAADGPSAFPFYEKLFGWTKGDSSDMGPLGIYYHFSHDGEIAGGVMPKMQMEPVPYWLFYFIVAEINAAVERVKADGGQIIHGPAQVQGGSMIAQCLDPQGAIFALVEPR